MNKKITLAFYEEKLADRIVEGLTAQTTRDPVKMQCTIFFRTKQNIVHPEDLVVLQEKLARGDKVILWVDEKTYFGAQKLIQEG